MLLMKKTSIDFTQQNATYEKTSLSVIQQNATYEKHR